MVINYAAFWVSSGVVARSSSGGKFASGAPAGVPGRRTINPLGDVVAADAHGLPKPARVRVALGVPNAINVAAAVVFLALRQGNPVGVFFSQSAVLFAALLAECGHALPHVALALQVIQVMLVILLVPYILRKVLLEVASPLPFLWETRP